MKGTALSALFAAATLLASPVFAADDLCAINLQKIDDSMATAGATSEGLDKAVTEHVDKAKAAQASGDTKECIAITSKVLERLEKPRKAAVRAAAAPKPWAGDRTSCRRRPHNGVYSCSRAVRCVSQELV